ncbi:MAG TPA: LamG-like jellyroll fold domain-containing protein [Terriglobales bacterium]|nr:LamG-like jellyroll fold domain-containing protein [Terriglobales bacterium]
MHNRLLSFTMGVAAAFSGVTNLPAENWPQFRGPDGQGHSSETNAPLTWSATENIAWKATVPGDGWSSPIVWNDRVFLTTATDGGESCHVLAFARQDGKLLWDTEVFKQTLGHKQGRNSFATPTPATDGERVYACFGDGSFAALNFDGVLAWTNREYPFYGEHGLGTSLRLHDGLILMARDGSSSGPDKTLGWQKPWDQGCILAIDCKTGKQRWKASRGSSRISHGTPVVCDHGGKAVVVSEAGDVVQGFDFQTGQRLWSEEVIGEGKVPSPVVGDGLVFTAGGWGGRESIKAFRLGHSSENPVWEQKKGMPKVPSMLYQTPYLFLINDSGLASCLKGTNGEIVWQEKLVGNFSASPVATAGRVYFTADNGETTVIEAGPEFKVLASNPLGEKIQASPAISQGQIFIRAEKNLFCVGRQAGLAAAKPKTSTGLVAHWTFNEHDGSQVKDSSAGQHHGTLKGAVRVPGKYGSALRCGPDALVEVPHDAGLDAFRDGFSVAAWIQRDADSTWNMIISREVKDGPSEYFGLAVFKNKALFSLDGDGAHYKNIQSAEDMPTGEWLHLAGTFDNREIRLYVNGKLVNSAPYSTPFQFADTNPIIIGGNTNTQGQKWVDCFRGLIEEVSLFDRALTEGEMLKLFMERPEMK